MADSVVTHDEEDFLVHGNPNVNPKWNRMSVTSWRSMYILGDLVNNCNLELEMAAGWFQANRLTLNAKKKQNVWFLVLMVTVSLYLKISTLLEKQLKEFVTGSLQNTLNLWVFYIRFLVVCTQNTNNSTIVLYIFW